jgi:RNA polymerase sigma factor (sigma-70 family)
MGAMAGTAGELAGIVESAGGGDTVAFGRIMAAHDDELYRICMAVGRDPAIAADAVQSAWSIAWRKLGTLRQPERLRPWLVSVAVNEDKKLLKQRQRRSGLELPLDQAEEAGGVDPVTGIAAFDLRAALERLDPDDRALLAMRYVAGFNASELSVALGLSPSGTRTRLERLLARLRQELA